MTRRELFVAGLAFLGVLLLVLMTFVTILGIVGRGALGGLMQRTDGVVFVVMVSFPIIAVALMGLLTWWIARRQGW